MDVKVLVRIVVAVCVLLGGQSVFALELPSGTEVINAKFKDACGPIAAYVAMQRLGRDPRLEDVASGVEWSPNEGTKVRNIARYLKGRGLRVQGVTLTYQQLEQQVRNGAAAIILTKEGAGVGAVDHALTIVGSEQSGLVSVGYPEVRSYWNRGALETVWGGQVLLVSSLHETNSLSVWVMRAIIAGAAGLGFGVYAPIMTRSKS